MGLEFYERSRDREIKRESLQEYSQELEAYARENADAFERLAEYELENFVFEEIPDIGYVQREGELQKERNMAFKKFRDMIVSENETGRDVWFELSDREFAFRLIYCSDSEDEEKYKHGTKISDKLIYTSYIE